MIVHLFVKEKPSTSYTQPGITEMISVRNGRMVRRMDVALTTGVDAIVRVVRCNLELVFKSMSQVTICTNIKMVIIFFIFQYLTNYIVNYLYDAEVDTLQFLFSDPNSASAGNRANNTEIINPSKEQQGIKSLLFQDLSY